MIHYFLKFIATTLLVLSLFSCSADKKIDDKNAIAVFTNINLIKPDPALKGINITIPKAITNQSWFGNHNDNNQKVENFAIENNGKIYDYKSIHINYSFVRNRPVVFAPVVTKDRIYILDDNGNLYARDSLNYQAIWQKKLSNAQPKQNFTNGKISYFDNKIFATSGYNVIFCINANNGEILWQKTLSSIPVSTPISDGNQVFLITDNNQTYSLSALDGSIKWIHSGISKATTIFGSANPVLYNNKVISSYSSGEIYALNKKDGEFTWVYDLNVNKIASSDFILSDIDATPLIKDNVTYAIGNGGLMMAIRAIDGKILWQKELASIIDFWIAGDFIYLINNDNQLICLYRKTGGIIWVSQLKKYLNDKKPASHIIYNGIIMAGDHLLMINSNHELLVISPFDGKILQTKKLSGKVSHNPIVVNKKLYLYIMNKMSTALSIIE